MVKYSREPENAAKVAKARASDLRTSFKNMRETAMAIKGLELSKAKKYLNNVLEKKDVVPLRRFGGSAGRSNLCKKHNFYGPGRFPEKSVKHLLDLLTNAESNTEGKDIDTENLYISHIQVNQACKGRRRTYRAHGRINAYMSNPCHVEVILAEKDEFVKKPEEEGAGRVVRKTKKQLAAARLKNGASA
ncbi:large subunit ribosomal protein L17e, cytoplasmic [Guillardia theta CCMP2712]|uniref:Large subunit ribosomal protein L17e, cytoplasmic n=2 Tax=Guillardia theta TaxID=55529 RepID=L1J568_GUITC|nr:large subunit ribosomal protein L17e, cytoplasmic [Guillardia theta CCMP2712]EKX43656.1 large subunit ribosomal protein L17e, cytoplasmic [Guillardia theta CCMP2712]|eukprot:XP_005830636.1 large subunit ribosomal protein L17e, cytoplasmic [Guillardia theta CCMP2712]